MKKELTQRALALLAITALIVAPAYASDKAASGQSEGTHMATDALSTAHGSGMKAGHGSQVAFRGTDLIGKDVVNRNYEELGNVEDIIIGGDGRVTYLVISHGGVLGIGDNLIPVPFSAVSRGSEGDDNIMLDISRQDLENAPNFAQTEWPDFDDANYENEVHGYFGGTPTSGTDASGDMKSEQTDSTTQKKVSD